MPLLPMRLDPAWLQQLQAAADQPPLRPRVPLWWGDAPIGSLEPALPARAGGASMLVETARGWELRGGSLTASLGELAELLRERGLAHAWRHEQLAVTDAAGEVLGTVERGVVRALGIATRAVHLLALAPGGNHWVQQRAFDKPTDPGLWDTLVGGMVPASDALQQALERESWEEAGLRPGDLRARRHGGCVVTRRPSTELAWGYTIERLEWFTCELPQGLVPANQDGEVAGFACLEPAELARQLQRGMFTLDAALLFAAMGQG